MSDALFAPWTSGQVEHLNTFQHSDRFHPFTCGQRDQHRDNPGVLVATESGWHCPAADCNYTQNWAHPFMAAPLPPDPLLGGTATSHAAELEFIRHVLGVFARADICDGLFWRVDGTELRFYANLSDVFWWGSADAEEITPERLPVLDQALADVLAIGQETFLPELYAARIRGMRPQGAAYPEAADAQALFDACGPEREVGLGNPRKPPAPTEGANS